MKQKWLKKVYWLPLLFLLIGLLLPLVNLHASKIKKTEKVFRITVKYENDRMKLQKVEPLEMILPRTIKEKVLTKDESPRGYFLQMFDEEKNPVLRLAMEDPTVTLMEYEDPEGSGRIRSKLVKHDEILFSILTPAPVKAQFILFSREIPGQEKIPVAQRKHEQISEMIRLDSTKSQIKEED